VYNVVVLAVVANLRFFTPNPATGVFEAKYAPIYVVSTLTIVDDVVTPPTTDLPTLVVTVRDMTVTYGVAQFPSTFVVNYSGVAPGDNGDRMGSAKRFVIAPLSPTATSTAALSALTSPVVGVYSVIVTGFANASGASPAYEFRYVAGTISVRKAPLLVRPLPFAVHFGEPAPRTYTVAVEGFVLGNTQGEFL
jgi:hypothetical protein